jgi:hypothetical protein
VIRRSPTPATVAGQDQDDHEDRVDEDPGDQDPQQQPHTVSLPARHRLTHGGAPSNPVLPRRDPALINQNR